MKNKRLKVLSLGIAIVLSFVLAVGPFQAVADSFSFFSSDKEQQLTEADIDEIEKIYQLILENYAGEVDKDQLVEGALKGMVDSLDDPYSQYFNQEEAATFEEDMDDSFDGIGVEITAKDEKITVVTTIDDTPAQKSGMQPHDIIISADGVELEGLPLEEVVSKVRGPKGTKVTLKIKRADQEFELEIERATIPIYSVKYEIDKEHADIAYLRINRFAENTSTELQEALEALKDKEIKKYIIDVRNNPGGYLTEALKISNMFLKEGQTIMQVEESGVSESFVADDQEYGKIKIDKPYVLLINEGSASASEILAATIKENTDYELIGEKTFGKGSIQTVFDKDTYGQLKLTIAKWLTPSGEWIHEEGVEPTIVEASDPIGQALVLNPEESLKKGDHNELTESLNLILHSLGYLSDSPTVFDEKVEQAVKEFQADNDLEVDGIVSGATSQKLIEKAQEYINQHDTQYDKAIEVLTAIDKE